jgi:hypothetical protein
MNWINEPNEEEIKANAGFVYRITCLTNNKKYIGKKLFTKSAKKKVVKKSAKGQSVKTLSEEEKKSRLKTVCGRAESDWKNYYGSSKELLEDLQKYGKENFKREILQLAPSKGVLAYFELKHQMAEDALFRDDYYNGIINIRLGRNIFPKSMLINITNTKTNL